VAALEADAEEDAEADAEATEDADAIMMDTHTHTKGGK
jgi:hypothetical protein